MSYLVLSYVGKRVIELSDGRLVNSRSSNTATLGRPRGYRSTESKGFTYDDVDESFDLAEAMKLRPKTRGDCAHSSRPCPWVSCRYHLWEKTLNFYPWEMSETCALDVADHGGLTLLEIGDILGVSRERIRQNQESGLAKLFKKLDAPKILHLNVDGKSFSVERNGNMWDLKDSKGKVLATGTSVSSSLKKYAKKCSIGKKIKDAYADGHRVSPTRSGWSRT